MGEIVLTFIVEQLLERVGSMAIQEIARVVGLKKDLQKLSDFAKTILPKVQKARNIQAENRQALNPLLINLQDVLYSIEDMLDDFSYEILRRQIEYRSQPWPRMRGFASRNNPILFRIKMACKVKKINQSLDDIEKQAVREFVLTGEAPADLGVVPTGQLNRVTVSSFDELEPLPSGREDEVKIVINMLEGSSSTPSKLTVISIVGFGGLGKTTLGRMVFHEVKERIFHEVKERKLFDETIWVHVSEHFNEKKICKDMLEALDAHAGGLDNLDAILLQLGKKLENKRFFLVLDDVWEPDRENCDKLRNHLLSICKSAGNFVVVTARNSEVAKAMDTKDEHLLELKGLGDKECWDIIKKKCLRQWGGSMPKELEGIGLDVAKKCKGVPLAAKVVGGTLCQKKNRDAWSEIQNSDAWEQIDGGKEILPVLKLSFHHLDAYLKQCFVYCSLFPKNFEYNKETLIELWMAEGFLHTASTNLGVSAKSMEDVGDECFDGLIVHSFFQVVEIDERGNIKSCKMHDLLHDLATSVSNYKRLTLKDESIWIYCRTSNHQHNPSVEELERSGAKNVRSVVSNGDDDIFQMFSTFKSLRSLDISCADLKKLDIPGLGLKELSSAIERLKYLRYLDISYNDSIKELPEIITKLYNLQTLCMIQCWRIRMLPTSIVNLERLRHIHFDKPDLKIYYVGRLIELRTLPHFEVRPEEGFRMEELKNLNELRGSLSIDRLQNVRDSEEAMRANLKEKKLVELVLEWNEHSNNNDENVLEGLVPPPTIKRLMIKGYKGLKFPNWMSIGINNSPRVLTQLVELTLRDCNECEMMPLLGHLPCLKILEVVWLNRIRSISGEFYGESKREVALFPELKKFSITHMHSLEEWGAALAIEGGETTNIKVFPLLRELEIRNCFFLKSIPLRHLSSLVSLTIARCENMEYLSNDVQNLPYLDHLHIEDCGNLVSLSSVQGVVSLHYLGIKKCPNLRSVPHWIKDCTSMRELSILKCQGLTSIDDDIFNSLTQLKKLSLGPFSKELEDFTCLNSIHLLSQIEILEIRGWLKLKTLPQQLQHLTTLKELTIANFEGVETLPDWLGNLSSLQNLSLDSCDNLKKMPTTMRRLSNLTWLSSHACPLLKRTYDAHTGPDRHDISHIPNIYLN